MEAPRPGPRRRLGLSGKLLLLTIPLVMIAGILIYVPAIANFRMNRLNDRLAAANTAALVLDAAPLGMVPDSLSRQILTSIGARAVAIKMGQQRRLLASAGLPAGYGTKYRNGTGHKGARNRLFVRPSAGARNQNDPGDGPSRQ